MRVNTQGVIDACLLSIEGHFRGYCVGTLTAADKVEIDRVLLAVLCRQPIVQRANADELREWIAANSRGTA